MARFALDIRDEMNTKKPLTWKYKVFWQIGGRSMGYRRKRFYDLWCFYQRPQNKTEKTKYYHEKNIVDGGEETEASTESGVFADPGGICYNGVSCVLDMKYLKTSLLRLLLTQTFFVVFRCCCYSSQHSTVLPSPLLCYYIPFFCGYFLEGKIHYNHF